jgi:hypothetical protein
MDAICLGWFHALRFRHPTDPKAPAQGYGSRLRPKAPAQGSGSFEGATVLENAGAADIAPWVGSTHPKVQLRKILTLVEIRGPGASLPRTTGESRNDRVVTSKGSAFQKA